MDAGSHYDLLIIGAGISGISAACHMKINKVDARFLVLERRDTFGGTWDLFNYPGIRSDSDMFTFGFSFKPWMKGNPLATGAEIKAYMQETIAAYDLQDVITYSQAIEKANWSSTDQRWTVWVRDLATGEGRQLTCTVLHCCTGYYKYEAGYTPEFKGSAEFKGQIIHPQHWPEDLDYTGKKVVVIGSGATAVTLVPAMAEKAAHMTMLQRSPTYVMSRPGMDKIALFFNKILPEKWAYGLNRWKNILLSIGFYTLARRWPRAAKKLIISMVKKALNKPTLGDQHFTPRYDPWDQRLCLVPDNNLFEAINAGKASVVTDGVDHMDAAGIQLAGGDHLDADIIITATGLDIQFLGGMDLSVDGKTVTPTEHVSYRGMMFSNIPNFFATFGYTNASWTLKADLTSDYMSRMIIHMQQTGYRTVMPVLDKAKNIGIAPLADLQSGYLLRAVDRIPKQGKEVPWRNKHNYISDLMTIKYAPYDDGILKFD